ncbi:ABC transporter permease/M1 family aminopeptidase [Maribacter antarcticus]|uniref:ABC transporter permease/M1 family aminopeptidase n=1 Tax=Maribacter antarcticus TaxID=505250 RepID=UPI00068819C7|nr:M1 family aminopeptidase [Maribacter antarcticus]
MMWYDIFKFELKYRVKRADTYIFFVFLLLFSIVSVDFVYQGMDFSLVKKNSPLIVAKTMGAVTGFCMIIASMIMGVSVLRDFEYNIESLLFSNPIKKRDYLLGRFLGSFTVLFFVFSGVFFGMILGEYMPWHQPNHLLPFNLFTYLKPFVMILLPILFFGACLFFITGALTRKLMVVYTQGVFIFVIFMLTKAITNDSLKAILDPFSLTTLTSLTKSWTGAEISVQAIPFSGVLLYNKLFWVALGALILGFGYKKFEFNVVRSKRTKKKKSQVLESEINHQYDIKIPEFSLEHGIKSKWSQLMHFSWFYFVSICKQTSFWAIVICGMIIILINSVSLGTVYGVDSYPATYFIVEELREMSLYFFFVILIFYSGELIWKERSVKLNLIYDSSPMSDFINIAGKYLGLILIYVVLIVSLIISGILFQTINGYYNYNFQVYFYGFFLEILPFLALFTLVAFIAQVVVNNKFAGIMVTILFFILNMTLALFGFDHDLYFFGGSSIGTYSDMNGYGHFMKPYLIIKIYWFLFGILLLIIASVVSVRGTESNLIKRIRASKHRISKSVLKLGLVAVVAFILLGSYIFYNTNILNEHWTNAEKTAFRVGYEKTLKQFEYLPQPKIVAVNLKLALYPKSRDYIAEGVYVLKNTTDTAIEEIHIQKLLESKVALEGVTFEGGATTDNRYSEFFYYNYKLKQPLQSGDSIKMSFKQLFTTQGFEQGRSSKIVNNGIFFNNNDFPTLGYTKKYELQDKNDRVENNLSTRSNKAKREDSKELVNARSGGDSDGIRFEIVIGTDKNQTAIAPGNLLKSWKENNRNYFHYKMDTQMINFYSIVSAEYEVKKDTWLPTSGTINKPVDLEIYYHKEHDYNLDRMMESMKASFDYFSTNFSPYQYEQMRILEFPRYAEFAQSFPGTVPFSEAIGFILNINDDKDVDMAFYVTAHELAHQWFGMQIEAANVQGQLMLLETLSQYAATMVLKQHYSEEKVQQFLELQKDKYIEGQRNEGDQEPSLALVENQDYIYYAKGAINMYEFQKQIGEANVNLALKRFISDWNTIDGKLKMKTKRYPTTEDLLGYFRAVAPSHQKHISTDLFESVGELKTN